MLDAPNLLEKAREAAHYDSLFESGKVWYTTKEAAAVLGVSRQFVRDSFQSQNILGQEITSDRATSSRKMKLIHRDCLVIFLMETANYEAAEFVSRMQKLILRRPQKEIFALRDWMNQLERLGGTSCALAKRTQR